MRTYIEWGGQILAAVTPETGAEYRAKNREIKSRNRLRIVVEFNYGIKVEQEYVE